MYVYFFTIFAIDITKGADGLNKSKKKEQCRPTFVYSLTENARQKASKESKNRRFFLYSMIGLGERT